MLVIAQVHESFSLMAPFENNLINWIVLVGVIIWLARKNLPPVILQRSQRIEQAITDAQKARQESEAFFAEQKKKIENYESEAQAIVTEAKRVAEEIKAQIARETELASRELESRIESQIANERNIAINQLRAQAAAGAIQMAEASLPGNLTSGVKDRLFNDFTEQLDEVKAAVGARK